MVSNEDEVHRREPDDEQVNEQVVEGQDIGEEVAAERLLRPQSELPLELVHPVRVPPDPGLHRLVVLVDQELVQVHHHVKGDVPMVPLGPNLGWQLG